MSRFTETVRADTPRLVVMFRQEGENERFQWGIIGAMPILTLVGFIALVQHEIPCVTGEDDDNFCPDSALVIVWDAKHRLFDWFCHPDIPSNSLRGMLEIIKATLVGTHIARQAAAQQVLLGPDGKPVRR